MWRPLSSWSHLRNPTPWSLVRMIPPTLKLAGKIREPLGQAIVLERIIILALQPYREPAVNVSVPLAARITPPLLAALLPLKVLFVAVSVAPLPVTYTPPPLLAVVLLRIRLLINTSAPPLT